MPCGHLRPSEGENIGLYTEIDSRFKRHTWDIVDLFSPRALSRLI